MKPCKKCRSLSYSRDESLSHMDNLIKVQCNCCGDIQFELWKGGAFLDLLPEICGWVVVCFLALFIIFV